MKKKIKISHIALLLVVVAIGVGTAFIPKGLAAGTEIEISTAEQLYNQMNFSKTNSTAGITYKLTNDIKLDAGTITTLMKEDKFSFGSTDYPFAGTFDGNGYKVSGLDHNMAEAEYSADTGLFAQTENAVIKNLIVTEADIDADQRGGIIAGKAVNTVFENVTVRDSYIRISCANNVLTLVTDGGLRGGALVGQAEGCVFYNCESYNTRVNNNNTAGVSALGGKGLYLGGLIGKADSTLIEYCRVTGEIEEDGTYKSQVTSQYDVAVGALGGNTLYVGGIVGELSNGSKVIDSFSTAYLYYYAATYVSVGAGNTGHAGGIAAAIYGDRCEISRCHYAGKMESKQYNAVLVIPIIQNNVGLSGISDKVEEEEMLDNIFASYFKESVTGEIDTLGSDETTSEYGPQNDEHYLDREFWESHDFDFVGTKRRSGDYNTYLGSTFHANKWVMDYTNGYPVHGKSVAATLDFPGAGIITIGSTDLITSPVSTSNPYQFAVQAITSSETNVNLKAEVNDGYRFVGWYKVPNVTAISLTEDHSYFEDIFESTDPNYRVDSATAEYIGAECADNDLFIARYQAQVAFHDIRGNVINTSGEPESNTDDDWYDYEAALPEIIPVNRPSSTTAALIGWTTAKNGFETITTDQLIEIKNSGQFYEASDCITHAMELYPVYADLISNVTTIFEGYDVETDPTKRSGVGKTYATMEEDGVVFIHVTGEDGKDVFLDGYRFLGWYEQVDGKEYLVSTMQHYGLKNVDLTAEHTYIARFEYRVDYYSDTKADVADIDSEPYARIWYRYQQEFKHLQDVPLDGQDSFVGWYYGSQEDGCSCSNIVESGKEVEAPFVVHAHIKGSSSYDILITSDFPNAGVLSNSGSPATDSFTIKCVPNEGYNFIFWACGASNKNEWIGKNSEWKAGIHLTTRQYHYEAHLSADVRFYGKTGTEITSVTRNYNEKILHSGIEHTYKYPLTENTVTEISVFSAASPTSDMVWNETDTTKNKEDYYFIGWINGTEIGKGSDEWNYIYDVADDSSCTSSISKVLPYLVTEADVVTEALDLYPVYAKYNVSTTTNIAELGVPTGVNIPSNPIYSYVENGDGTRTLTLTVDENTFVSGNEGIKYEIISLLCIKEDGISETITPNEYGTYTYMIEAGLSYKFIANYEPMVVVYHLNDSDTKVEVRNAGETLGETPFPSYNLSSSGYVFVAWTTEEPIESGYHVFDSYTIFESSEIAIVSEGTIIMNSLELWPVYVKNTVLINSNIDDIVGTDHRSLLAPNVDGGDWIAQAQETVVHGEETYQFVEWNVENNRVSSSSKYILENKDVLSDKTYTAIYEKIPKSYQIHYYDTDGQILHTVKVYEDDTRTFVQETQVDGEAVTIPVDVEAFVAIVESLESNVTFREWQWVKNDGTIIKWNDFCNTSVETTMTTNNVTEMNLYPVIRTVTATDSTGASVAIVVGGTKETDEEGNVTERVTVGLDSKYTQTELKVHVEDVAYSPNAKGTPTHVVNIPVDLYMKVENEETGQMEDTMIATEKTDVNGDATFYLQGVIKIVKEVDDNRSEGVFLFDIYRKGVSAENSDEITETYVQTVVVTLDEPATIILPFGEYIIKENTDWAWRYSKDSSITEQEVKLFGSNRIITFENQNMNNHWFDDIVRKKNEYTGTSN